MTQLKNLMAFMVIVSLTVTPTPMQARIDTSHAAFGTAIIATGAMTLCADAYLKDCQNLHKEPSMREFVSYVGKFAKNLISNKGTRSAAMEEHPLLVAAVATTVGAAVLTVGNAAYKKLYPEVQNPPTPPAQPLTPEEEKAKAKADETALELAAITTLEELSSPTAKTKEECQKAYNALTSEKQKENNEARNKARTEQAQKAKAEQEKQEQERASRAKVDEKSVTYSDAILKEEAQRIITRRSEALAAESKEEKEDRLNDENAIAGKELKAKEAKEKAQTAKKEEEKAKKAVLAKSKQEKANAAHQEAQAEEERKAKAQEEKAEADRKAQERASLAQKKIEKAKKLIADHQTVDYTKTNSALNKLKLSAQLSKALPIKDKNGNKSPACRLQALCEALYVDKLPNQLTETEAELVLELDPILFN